LSGLPEMGLRPARHTPVISCSLPEVIRKIYLDPPFVLLESEQVVLQSCIDSMGGNQTSLKCFLNSLTGKRVEGCGGVSDDEVVCIRYALSAICVSSHHAQSNVTKIFCNARACMEPASSLMFLDPAQPRIILVRQLSRNVCISTNRFFTSSLSC
jgi:hypothetical protein